MSVQNQLITKTKKVKPQKDFLMISNKDWMEASKILSPSGFQMYLWLIRHDGSFNNELSKQAFMNDFNVKESTYKRAWAELKENGYAVKSAEGSNIYYIYTSPTGGNGVKNEPAVNNGVKNEPDIGPKMNLNGVKNDTKTGSKMNIEIDKQIDINNNKQLNQTECGNNPEEGIKINKEEFINQGLANYATRIKDSSNGNMRFKAYGKYYEIIQ